MASLIEATDLGSNRQAGIANLLRDGKNVGRHNRGPGLKCLVDRNTDAFEQRRHDQGRGEFINRLKIILLHISEMTDLFAQAEFTDGAHHGIVFVALFSGENQIQVGHFGCNLAKCFKQPQMILVNPKLSGIEEEFAGQLQPIPHGL